MPKLTSFSFMTELGKLPADIRFSLRQLRRSPSFALTTILTLTMAIAANVVVFGVIDALILHPLPVPNARQIFQIQGLKGQSFTLSYPNYRDLRDRNRTFSSIAAFRPARVGIGVDGVAEPIWGYLASGNYFGTLGVQPALGRFFGEADDRSANGSPVAVLSYDCWQARFHADPAIVGKPITISKHPYVVLGVAPKNFNGTERFLWPDVWIPMQDGQAIEGTSFLEERAASNTWVIGRLQDGVATKQADDDLRRVASQLAREYPKDNDALTLRVARVGLLGDMLGGPVRGFLAGVMGLALLVLLAACANLGSLFSSRTADRAKELGIRLAIGSSRSRIVRQLLTESVLVALIGGAVASVASAALLNSLTRWRPGFGELPIHFLVQPNWTIYVGAGLLALVTGILFAILPARQVWRTDPIQTLKSAGSTSAGSDRLGLRSILLVIQIALCCLLVTASFVALRGLGRTFSTPFGFQPGGVTLATLDVHLGGYGKDQQAVIQERLLEKIATIPGVQQAAYANTTPLSINQSRESIYPSGTRDYRSGNTTFMSSSYQVSSNYFVTTGTRLLAGRAFSVRDNATAPKVAVINQTFARQAFGAGQTVDWSSLLGKHFSSGYGEEVEVVGIVEDGKYVTLSEEAVPAVFLPILQVPDSNTVLLVQSGRSSVEIAAAVRRAIADIDSNLPVFNIATWTDALSLVTFPARAATIALGVLGSLAIMLAVTGIFGLASYTVSRRLRELGIRVALGASSAQVLRSALGRTLILLGLGSAFGLLLGFAASRLLAGVVYQATASDPVVIVAVVLTMAFLGVASAALPARRAIKIDPVVLLREK